MTIKGLLTLSIAMALAIGIAVISGDLGNAIESSSRTKSLAAKQKLAQQQEEWDLEQEKRKEVLDEQIALEEWILETLRYVLPISIVTLIAITLYLFQGWANSEIRKANFEATMIKRDPVTMSYPILCFEGSNGQLRLHDPNTKDTMTIDRDREAVPLLVAHSTMVQLQTMAGEDQMINPHLLLGDNQQGG